MKRAIHILLNATTVLSLLLCAATLVLWARKRNMVDMLIYRSRRANYVLIASRDGVEYHHYAEDLHDPATWIDRGGPRWSQGWHHDQQYYGHRGNGFSFPEGILVGEFVVGFRYWLIGLMTSIAPAIWLISRANRRRNRHGFCPVCCYDLRATPDRCPECGTICKVAPPADVNRAARN